MVSFELHSLYAFQDSSIEDFNIAEDMNYGCEDEDVEVAGFQYQDENAVNGFNGEYYEEIEYY